MNDLLEQLLEGHFDTRLADLPTLIRQRTAAAPLVVGMWTDLSAEQRRSAVGLHDAQRDPAKTDESRIVAGRYEAVNLLNADPNEDGIAGYLAQALLGLDALPGQLPDGLASQPLQREDRHPFPKRHRVP